MSDGPPKKKQKKEKKEKKDKKRRREEDEGPTNSDSSTMPLVVSPIAKPLAGEKIAKKLHKLIKKVAKADSKNLRRGVKECVKYIRKGENGICVLAGDISPIDVITHLPILCEENDVPYCYVPSKVELGAAAMTKRPTSCVLVKSTPGVKELFDECVGDLPSL